MKSKKQNLSKLALAALLAAASTTAAAEAAEMFDTKPGVLLAAKCGAAKCGAFSLREEVADNSSDMNNPYNPKYNTYRMEKGEKPKDGSQNNPETSKETQDSKGRYYYFSDEESNPAMPKNGKPMDRPNMPGHPNQEEKSAYGARQPYQTNPNTAIADANVPVNAPRSSAYYSSYNVNHGGGDTTPVYLNSYPNAAPNPISNPMQQDNFAQRTTFNRQYNPDYDYNRAAATTVTSSQTLNEAQLLGMLNPQGRAMYLSLDPEAKALAIQLASEDSYKDKNLAIREAQRRMNDRLGVMRR